LRSCGAGAQPDAKSHTTKQRGSKKRDFICLGLSQIAGSNKIQPYQR
jgi:hypothetical protein